MVTPFVRAKAKDNADQLDNVLASLDEYARREVFDYVLGTLEDIQAVLANAEREREAPILAYSAFRSKLKEYLPAVEDYSPAVD